MTDVQILMLAGFMFLGLPLLILGAAYLVDLLSPPNDHQPPTTNHQPPIDHQSITNHQ